MVLKASICRLIIMLYHTSILTTNECTALRGSRCLENRCDFGLVNVDNLWYLYLWLSEIILDRITAKWTPSSSGFTLRSATVLLSHFWRHIWRFRECFLHLLLLDLYWILVGLMIPNSILSALSDIVGWCWNQSKLFLQVFQCTYLRWLVTLTIE